MTTIKKFSDPIEHDEDTENIKCSRCGSSEEIVVLRVGDEIEYLCEICKSDLTD